MPFSCCPCMLSSHTSLAWAKGIPTLCCEAHLGKPGKASSSEPPRHGDHITLCYLQDLRGHPPSGRFGGPATLQEYFVWSSGWRLRRQPDDQREILGRQRLPKPLYRLSPVT